MHLAAKPPKPTIPAVKQPSFFDEQSRHRTRAKTSAILIGIVGCLMVWGFGFVVFAALIFYTSFLSRLLPHQVTETYAAVMHYVGGPVGVSVLAALFTAGVWWFASRILMSDTSAGLIWRIRARLPDPADPVDQQLSAMAEDIAATAATRAPAVLVYEGPHANAAVIGDQPEGAGLLVSRGLLTTLDSHETRAVVAHLIASTVNGDLQLTAALLRVYYMIGISVTLLDLPFSSGARKAMALLWRYARQSDPESIAALGEELGAALTRTLHPDGLESLTLFTRKMIGEEKDVRSIVTTVLLVPLLPFLVLRLAAGVGFGLTSLFLTGPLVTLLLRSRRELADATAVQLTRNPNALARAVIHLYSRDHAFAEAGWSEMNFIIGHETARPRVFDGLRARIAQALTNANNFSHRLGDNARSAAILAAAAQPRAASCHNFVFGFHPPLGTRIRRLNQMGAETPWSGHRDSSSWIIAAVALVVVAVFALLALS